MAQEHPFNPMAEITPTAGGYHSPSGPTIAESTQQLIQALQGFSAHFIPQESANPTHIPSGRVRSGAARMATMTPEERSAMAKKGAAARWKPNFPAPKRAPLKSIAPQKILLWGHESRSPIWPFDNSSLVYFPSHVK